MNQLHQAAGQDGGVAVFKGHLGTPLSVVCDAVFATQFKSAFPSQRINDFNWETSLSSCESSRQRTQTSANFPKNNRRSHEPTTQPLPPTAAHHSLQQLWLPLRQQPLHKMSQRNISPRGKTGNKTKTTFVFFFPCHFIVMMEIRASFWDYFTPLTFSVMRVSAGQLQGCRDITVWWKATAENQLQALLILWHTHFTRGITLLLQILILYLYRLYFPH